MPEYQELLQLLSRLREDHAVVSLYLGYHELDTMRDLYLVDSSAGESCLPGDYDDVEADQVEQLRAGNYDMPAYITNYPDYGWLCSASAAIENENGEISVSALFIKPLEIFRGRNIGINDIVIIGCNKRITV